jgi:hypothetical protein
LIIGTMKLKSTTTPERSAALAATIPRYNFVCLWHFWIK